MKEPFDQELLSAYLDGELTAAQQARVERLLAENPKAKQLLDELRALSATLQSLPQEKLGEDLSPFVLRQAERELLTGSRSPLPARARVRQMLSHMLSRRALAWAAAAVVIAVVVTITEYHQRRQHGDRAVAVWRAGDKQAEHKDAEPARADGGGQRFDDLAPPGVPRRPPAIHAPGLAVEGDDAPAMPSADAPAAPAAPRNAERNRDADGTKGRPVKAYEVLAESKPAPAAGIGAAKPAPQAALPEGRETAAVDPGHAAAPSLGQARAASMPQTKPDMPQTKPDMPEGGEGPPRLEGVTAGAVQTAPSVASAGSLQPMGPVADGAGFQAAQGAAQPDGVLVVRCDITPEAARNRALDRLLASNNIALEDAGAAPADEDKGAAPVAVHPGPKPRSRTEYAKGQIGADTATAALTGLDVIYVEAAPEQIEPVLAAMNAMPSQFLTVSIEPPPQAQSQRGANLNANQYDFSRYSRAGAAAGSQQPDAVTQELRSPDAAPAATGPQGLAVQPGARPGEPIALGASAEAQFDAAPNQTGDKALQAERDNSKVASSAIGQQFGGFTGRAVRVQLPQKLAADNVEKPDNAEKAAVIQKPDNADNNVKPDVLVEALSKGVTAPKPPAGFAGAQRSEVHKPLPGESRASAMGGGRGGVPEARPHYSMPGKGKIDLQAAPPPPAEAPAQATESLAAPPSEPADPDRERPKDSSIASTEGELKTVKTGPAPTEQQRWQQMGSVYRVLFVIRVVPDVPAGQPVQSDSEKSQAHQ